jgi:hypothetical protein
MLPQYMLAGSSLIHFRQPEKEKIRPPFSTSDELLHYNNPKFRS